MTTIVSYIPQRLDKPINALLRQVRGWYSRNLTGHRVKCNLPLCVGLAVGFFLIVSASMYYTKTLVQQHLLEAEAERSAKYWAQQFIEKIPAIESIANGREPDRGEVEKIATFAKLGSVFRFKLFDRDGMLRLVSDDKRTFSANGESLRKHNSKAATVLMHQRTYVEVKSDGKRKNRPTHYSEAYVPIIKNGRVAGVVEAYVDQTALYASYVERAENSAFVLSFIVAFVFAAPAIAFYVRSEQANAARRHAQFLAAHDTVTGIANRSAFQAVIETALANTGEARKVALLCIDLDRFKEVNDTLGHDVGDRLLRAVAERLQSNMRENDFVARLGGDEFAVVQSDIAHAEEADRLAGAITAALRAPFLIDGHRIEIAASVGIAIAPDDATTDGQLFKAGDIALYRAKAEGRGDFRFFEAGMDQMLRARRVTEQELRTALEQDQFVLLYQPQIEIESRRIVGFEALIRWHHPQRGLISQQEFITFAEQTGMILDVGRWVLRQACRDAARWPHDIGVAVNLSAVQVMDGSLVDDVVAALDEHELHPERLELEVTESVLLADCKTASATLTELGELGIRIALDDFGTGYSSLSYLQKFPLHKVKIDKSFIQNVEESENSLAIIRAVISLSNSIGKITTAEGVETPEQLALLHREGCCEAQGFLLSPPMPVDEIAAFLTEHAETLGNS